MAGPGFGVRRDGTPWTALGEFLFVAIDAHARIAFTAMHPNEAQVSAVRFLERTVAYFQSIGVRVKAVLTDNGSAFRSKAFAAAGQQFGIKQRFTRPYRPQTNGEAERFIQSALREWAYGTARIKGSVDHRQPVISLRHQTSY